MQERHARAAAAGVLFVYVMWMRTHDVATTFLMLGEQTRDWTIALGSVTQLPLVGAPSTAGGRGLGPAYYWLLWLGRVILGPFMDNLPHAGGVTVALLQSIGDVWLFAALSRRMHWALALAASLLIASGPFDIAISSVIWNPPVAEALVKMAIASALMSAPSPLRSSDATSSRAGLTGFAVTVALAWMAVQTHLSAAFAAAPLIAGVLLQPFVERTAERSTDVRRTFDGRSSNVLRTFCVRSTIVLAVVLVLEIPFIVSRFTEPGAPAGPTAAIASITSGQSFRPFFGLDTVTGVTGNLFLPMSDTFKFWIPTVICGALVTARYRRDLVLLGASVGGVLTMSLVFATWTRNYDGYWFLTMVPSLALIFTLTFAAIPSRRAVAVVGALLTMWFVSWQPSRLESSKRYFEYPQYATMVRGSREVLMRAPVVRDIRVAFDVHPTMDRQFVYKILGGRIDASARYVATINADGSVRLDAD